MIIQIKDNTKAYLETLRTHPRETWDDLIQKLIIQDIKQEVSK